MARVNLILCDWCKEETSESTIHKLAIGVIEDPFIFEICIKCRDEITTRCMEKVSFSSPKKKVNTRAAEEVKKKSACKHEKTEFLEPNNLRCEDCNEIMSA